MSKEKERSAYQWGIDHQSCQPALEWRKSLGPSATQKDAWQKCQRVDWLFRQLRTGLTRTEKEEIQPVLQQWLEDETTRLIKQRVRHCGHEKLENWARNWLDKTDRTWKSACYARQEAYNLYCSRTQTKTSRWTVTVTEMVMEMWTATEMAMETAMETATETGTAMAKELAGSLRRRIPVWRWKV